MAARVRHGERRARLQPDPAVVNGFSDLIVELYGPVAGPHARSAIGVAALPQDIPVEIEAEVAYR